MSLLSDSVIMVQYFPDTGDYIVHREGATVEVYSSDEEIQDARVHRFLRECLADRLFHENTVYLSVNKGSGSKANPTRQILYCKSFDAEEKGGQNTVAVSNINWALWEPNKSELTVNRGTLGVAKKVHLSSLSDAPKEVLEFMEACTDGDHIALAQHYSEPVRKDGELEMVEISEYFFSQSKIIYGFQHERVYPITIEEMESLGLYHM